MPTFAQRVTSQTVLCSVIVAVQTLLVWRGYLTAWTAQNVSLIRLESMADYFLNCQPSKHYSGVNMTDILVFLAEIGIFCGLLGLGGLIARHVERYMEARNAKLQR